MNSQFQHAWMIFDPPLSGVDVLDQRLAESLGREERYVHLGRGGFTYVRDNDLEHFIHRSANERAKTQILCGSGLAGGMDSLLTYDALHEVGFVREPASSLAHFFFSKSGETKWKSTEDQKFQEWLAQIPQNYQTHYLCKRLGLPKLESADFSMERLMRRLDRFQFIGTETSIDPWLSLFFQRLSFPTPSQATILAEINSEPVIELAANLQFREIALNHSRVDSDLHSRIANAETEKLSWFHETFRV